MLSPTLLLAQVATDPLALFQLFAKAILAGSVPASTVAALLVIGLVALLRWAGPKLRALLPDHTIADKVLTFLFASKPGGWLLNGLSTSGAGLLAVFAADPTKPLTFALAGPILGASFTVAGIWEFVRDLWAMWQARKAAPALAPVP